MIKSMAHMFLYLGFFGWLFGSKEEDGSKKNSTNTDITTKESNETTQDAPTDSTVQEQETIQPQAPLLFSEGLPVSHATIPIELGHSSSQNCGTCHQHIYDQWKGSGHGNSKSYEKLRVYISQKDGLVFKDSPLCQNCHLPIEEQHHQIFSFFLDNNPQRPQYTENTRWNPLLYTESITCISCHARNNQILGVHNFSSSNTLQSPVQTSSDTIDTDSNTDSNTDQTSNITTEHRVTQSEQSVLPQHENKDADTTQINITVSPEAFLSSMDRVHSALHSTELSQSQMCATCHQSTDMIGNIYNTYDEWRNSIYSEQGVGCTSCHYPSQPTLDGSSSFATHTSHAIARKLHHGLSIDISLPRPIIQRGQITPLEIALINTGSGHAIPTNPWKQFVFVAEIQDENKRTIWKSKPFVLGSQVQIISQENNIQENNTQEKTETPSNSTPILKPSHTLGMNQRKQILPFQKEIWIEEIVISTKKASGLGTLIVSETTSQYIFVEATIEIR